MKRAVWVVSICMVWALNAYGVTLRDTTVTSSVITLQDICSDIIDTVLASTVVAQSPVPGGHVYITKRDLERRFRSHGVAFSGPETIKITRNGYPLDWSRLENELSALLKNKTKDSIEIQLKSGKRAIVLDDAQYTFAFQPGERIGGYMTVPTTITTAHSQRTLMVAVYVAVYKDVIVPLQRINRHTQLSESMLTVKRLDCAGRDFVVNMDEISAFRAKRGLEIGKPITFDAIEKMPDVLKGSTLTVLLTTRSLHVEVSAVAMADAYKGECVQVKLSTGKTMTASLLHDGSAVIKEGL